LHKPILSTQLRKLSKGIEITRKCLQFRKWFMYSKIQKDYKCQRRRCWPALEATALCFAQSERQWPWWHPAHSLWLLLRSQELGLGERADGEVGIPAPVARQHLLRHYLGQLLPFGLQLIVDNLLQLLL
jgi:hypothetical protein